MMKNILTAFGLTLCMMGAGHAETVELYSQPHRIDRVIKSMEGEVDNAPFQLLNETPPELVWVTAGKVTVVDAQTSAPEPIEMLCHSHMEFPFQSFNPNKHNSLFNYTTHLDVKLFTLVQGQTEIQLPKGFGIPILSNETFEFSSMIISPEKPKTPLMTKAKGTFEFTRDSQLKKPIKPLFWRGLATMVPVSMTPGSPTESADHCSPELIGSMSPSLSADPSATPAAPSMNLVHKHKSGKYDESYHWMVPPGRHEYRYTLENGLMIAFDTTMHYANVHLHPYAESLELRDLTTGRSLFKGLCTTFKNEAGVSHLTHFSSEAGLPVYKDHEYELVTVYNNTTDHDIDAMAIMFIYVLDKSFDRNQVKLSAAPSTQGVGGEKLP